MLKVFVNCQGKTVQLSDIVPGANGSMTDYTNPGTEIIIFTCQKDNSKSYVMISGEGATIEPTPEIRVVLPNKDKLRHVKDILPGEKYEYKLLTKFGPATLILEHIK